MNALELLRIHLDALYRFDRRGRIERCNCADEIGVPRFHLCRSPLGNIWCMRGDLGTELVRRLSELAGREAPLAPGAAPPDRLEFLRRALEAHHAIDAHHSGPAFVFEAAASRPPSGDATVRALAAGDEPRLHPALVDARDALKGSRPCIGALRSGTIVSVCHTARGVPERAAEAGVETAPEFRARGFATQVVAAWAEAVRAEGGLPLYSTDFRNAASRALAQRLGLIQYGEDWSWC